MAVRVLLIAALVAMGCNSEGLPIGESDGRDLSVPRDLGVQDLGLGDLRSSRDLARPPDLRAVRDLSSPEDLSISVSDLATPPDLQAPPDLTTVNDLDPPRPVFPLSSMIVSSRRPALRWELAGGADGAIVDLCTDRPCSSVIASMSVAGTTATPGIDLPVGSVFWRLRSRAGASVGWRNGPTWQFQVLRRNPSVSSASGSVFDVNGDGRRDTAITNLFINNNSGKVYVYNAGSNRPSAQSPSVVLSGPDGTNGYFGSSIASAGDVDGDGYCDLLVAGLPQATGSNGRVFLFRGGASGVSSTPSTVIEGPDPGGYFGDNTRTSMASAGDVNGDGYADVVVTAWAAGPNVTGHAFVYLGGPAGLSANYATEMIGPDGENGWFASEVSAGDFNADGYGDVVVASFGMNGNGKAFVYLGGPMGTPSMPSATFDGGDLAVFTSRTADINSDGYSDLILGGIVGGTDRVDVYLGSAIGLSATKVSSTTLQGSTRGQSMWWIASPGDTNGDGFEDLVVSTLDGGHATEYVFDGSSLGLSGLPAATLAVPNSTNSWFEVNVGGRGDVDGDGYDDLTLTVVNSTAGDAYAYTFWGASTGLSAASFSRLTDPDGPTTSFGDGVAMLLLRRFRG